MVSSGFEAALVLVIAIAVGIFFIGQWYGTKMMQQQAVIRGHALFCPESGQFAWDNECNKQGEQK